MKPIPRLYLFLTIATTLSSCLSGGLTIKPTSTETQLPVLTSILPTSMPALHSTQTATIIPPTTLEPEKAEDFILNLLQEPDCFAPCFLGIIPEKTTLGEANNIFTRLGLELIHTNTRNNEDFYALIYDFTSGLRISPVLKIQDDIVKSVDVGINPEKYQVDVPRQWLAYSPETLIIRYGTPSRVEFFVGRGAPSISYTMVIYFDAVDLIVEYSSYDIDFNTDSFRICPLTDQSDGVHIWMGQNPRHPPLNAVPLVEATTMTIEEFSKLMTGNPENACFNLKEEAFH